MHDCLVNIIATFKHYRQTAPGMLMRPNALCGKNTCIIGIRQKPVMWRIEIIIALLSSALESMRHSNIAYLIFWRYAGVRQ